MPQNIATKFVPRFHGSTFDGMVETLAGHFGSFAAAPIGQTSSFQWNTDFWTNGTLTLVTGQYHNEWRVKAVPQTAKWLSILSVHSGAIDISSGQRAIESRPGGLVLVNNHEADHFSVRGAPNISNVLRLDWSVIVQAVAAIFEIPLDGSLDLLPMVDLSTPSGLLVGNLVGTVISGMYNNGPLLQSPLAMSHLAQTLADLVVRTIPHRFSFRLEKRMRLIAPWHVRDAIDFMQANVAKPITMPAVAEAVGVSIRALEMGFRTFKEITPAAYLRTLRLRAARSDLLDPLNRQSVKAICVKWGFFHVGRFSAAYRAIFGENPSDTRKRSTDA
ncbi:MULTISPECIES: AraC family transcriptional regulator [unclassified Rhizobium]|uniref:AraC family transcriptional regulator n=1 Tax=unclassified Rhizobium TaxID=2613769 RepID=UPI000EA96ACA|nr:MULTISPECIES: AraC family transcriptional regulator [unclassified Rhizobium]AYG70059.1 AraC family transcriptional regulator [Rhizobium sp. CCGE531]AYG76434.1 AraC family transcriptional regulator [Rhizobium sp. CCGE532]